MYNVQKSVVVYSVYTRYEKAIKKILNIQILKIISLQCKVLIKFVSLLFGAKR